MKGKRIWGLKGKVMWEERVRERRGGAFNVVAISNSLNKSQIPYALISFEIVLFSVRGVFSSQRNGWREEI